jgi:amidohydrolase
MKVAPTGKEIMLDKARAIREQLSAWRRDIHSHPELGFKETRTAAKVAEVMEGLGARVRRGVAKTGIAADLGTGSPVVAIRADMDALPIVEANDVPYCSTNAGVMHACGHDAHTAMLLGTALLLSREKFSGTVRFIFQPSEEVADEENLSGAMRMVREGVMNGVDMVIGQHVDPGTPVGTIRIDSGPSSGGVDSWHAAVLGKGGHGAKPNETVDPFYLAAHIMMALYGIISRRVAPFDPAVVSIGSMHGGDTENVIPDRVQFSGTLRYTEASVQKQIHEEIRRAFELSRPLGGDYELRFEIGTSPMNNDPAVVDLIRQVGVDLLGKESVLPFRKELGAEDFGCFSDIAPGAMFVLGTLIEGNERFGHNPRFDIDERALPIGTAMLAETALRFLRSKTH